MVIYIITNKINKKIYIGQTTDFRKRKLSHIGASKRVNGKDYNKPLYKAIRKYGEENFDFSILEECKSIEHMNEREIYYIDKLNSLIDFGNGYNLEKGGNNGLKSNETKNKMSIANRGSKNPSYGKRGSNCHNAKKIICLDTGEIFGSAIECAEKMFGKNEIDRARKGISKCSIIGDVRYAYKGIRFRKINKDGSIQYKEKDI